MTQNNQPALSDAEQRCAEHAELPDYVLTYGTELCLVPQLKRYIDSFIDECEAEICNDLGSHESNALPAYSEGYDDGLRAAINAIRRLV